MRSSNYSMRLRRMLFNLHINMCRGLLLMVNHFTMSVLLTLHFRTCTVYYLVLLSFSHCLSKYFFEFFSCINADKKLLPATPTHTHTQHYPWILFHNNIKVTSITLKGADFNLLAWYRAFYLRNGFGSQQFLEVFPISICYGSFLFCTTFTTTHSQCNSTSGVLGWWCVCRLTLLPCEGWEIVLWFAVWKLFTLDNIFRCCRTTWTSLASSAKRTKELPRSLVAAHPSTSLKLEGSLILSV